LGANLRVVVGDDGYDPERVRELLAGNGVTVAEAREPWGGDDVVGLLVGTETEVRAADLTRLPALRVVATCSVGFDHVDVEEAERRGIWVCSVPDYCVEEVADHALALVLSLLRGVVVLDREVRAGGWDWKAAGELRRIRGTRLGIVGLGRTGRALAARSGSRSGAPIRRSPRRRSPPRARALRPSASCWPPARRSRSTSR
jgi:D-3-phosphoglycerate dehydrogenase